MNNPQIPPLSDDISTQSPLPKPHEQRPPLIPPDVVLPDEEPKENPVLPHPAPPPSPPPAPTVPPTWD